MLARGPCSRHVMMWMLEGKRGDWNLGPLTPCSLTADLRWEYVDSINLINLNCILCITCSDHCRLFMHLDLGFWLCSTKHPWSRIFLTGFSPIYFASDGTYRSLSGMMIALTLLSSARLGVLLLINYFDGCNIRNGRVQGGYRDYLFGLGIVSHHLVHGFLAIRRG